MEAVCEVACMTVQRNKSKIPLGTSKPLGVLSSLCPGLMFHPSHGPDALFLVLDDILEQPRISEIGYKNVMLKMNTSLHCGIMLSYEAFDLSALLTSILKPGILLKTLCSFAHITPLPHFPA